MFRRGCHELLRPELLRWRRRRPGQGFHWRSCTWTEQVAAADNATSSSARLTRRLRLAAAVPFTIVRRISTASRGEGKGILGADCGIVVGSESPAGAADTWPIARQMLSSTSASVAAETTSASVVAKETAGEATSVPSGSPPSAAARETMATSAETSSQTTASPEDSADATGSSKGGGGFFRFLKIGIGLTAGTACTAAGYATYAYETDELESKANQLQSEWFPGNSAASYDGTMEEGGGLNAGEREEISDPFGVVATVKKGCLSVVRMYLDARRSVEDQIKGFAAPSSEKLLPDLAPEEVGVYTLVLDLDETLIFADWRRGTGWRTFKRPGVEAFLEEMSKCFEIVVYTDQINMYGDPVMARLDPKGYVRFKLYRDATQYTKGKHMRDLSKLNRDPSKILYLSGHGLENCLHPENVVPIKPWKAEPGDAALLDLMPFLECIARQRPPDARVVLESYKGQDIPTAFRERSKEVQRRIQERRGHSFWQRTVTSGPRTSAAH
ncbi:hypothetical protein CBR_g55789 [Chara braunii]|uniref:Mitochondrial import inner membrane translocase subunit TIM50 n=1 Tax=Chara braunii TaxID=69332 RepID=A0A388MD73_CHABU|nr:hypothetical protein CBR_g55789 [Chara braunii]|eukprot:GBG92516.1 hypothetical protein CBR_g55789 [Chara braunii]